jgi:predicted RNA-binding protein with PUA-like domain
MSTLREHPNLVDMIVLRKGNRLSITPVTQFEFDTVVEIAEGL